MFIYDCILLDDGASDHDRWDVYTRRRTRPVQSEQVTNR